MAILAVAAIASPLFSFLTASYGQEVFRVTGWRLGLLWGAGGLGSLLLAPFVLTIGAADFSEGTRQALIAFVVRVPVALALGWLFLRRRSIYAPMGLHATFNAIAVLLSQP